MEFASMGPSTLLPKLAQLLQDEYNLHKGARDGIQFLYEELERTQAALREVGEVPREQLRELVKPWARDVREVSYDMEDIVDTFMVRVQGPEPPSKSSAKKFIKKMFNVVDLTNKAKARREVAKEIKGIKEQRVKEVADRRDRYKLDAIAPAKKTAVDPRITAMYTKVTELVGIGKAKDEVIARLTEGDAGQQERIVVVSIAGFGGLGKTTLAKAVYDEIKGQFDCTAFISVSRNPDPKKLLKDMSYALGKEKFKDDIHSTMLDETHLVDLVREFLRNKRYLIVIDDIWDKEPWDKFLQHDLNYCHREIGAFLLDLICCPFH
ncbi:hypothetical protein C2845_PM06G34850 [Panicum miliaceum]|uniref:Disease resistance protein RPP13-like n=1 Tax=Panicum miliaceum TaxID=4540 RepID=A0A3L6RB68_PANMI|nr:hypothetical protein C2845_PM06G34850 [Panicum miliaceum]